MGKLFMMTLAEVAEVTGGKLIQGFPADLVRRVTTRDRDVVGGKTLFIAFRGPNHDGHEFVMSAVSMGASAVLIDRKVNVPLYTSAIEVADTRVAYGCLARAHRLAYEIPVVGITGSYGKTTTRLLVSQALSCIKNVLSTQKNENNEIGVPLTLLRLDPSCEAAVIEMGMRGLGQIGELAQIAVPNAAVITNIGPQHIEQLGSLDNIAAAKAELLKALPVNGLAVLPGDDQYFDLLRESCPSRWVTFGEHNADWKFSNLHMENNGNLSFLIDGPNSQESKVEVPLLGRHNAFNATAAIALAVELGAPLEAAVEGLKMAQPEPGRGNRFYNRSENVLIIDDTYNAGPNSMRAGLNALRDLPGPQRKVAILGDMAELGAWAEEEHAQIGSHANFCAGIVIAVGKHADALLSKVREHIKTYAFTDAESAAQNINDIVRPGDVVLVKGSNSTRMDLIVKMLKNT